MMGKVPFEEFQSEDVQKMYCNREFPDLDGIPHADLIRSCWSQDFESVGGLIPFLDV